MAGMRGDDRQPDAMFSYVSAEQRVPQDHPLRAIRALVDDVLRDMSREFDGLYARVGRPSIPPERLLRAQLLQIFYSIRSERLLDGAAGLQPAVSLVRRHGHGRTDLGPDRVQKNRDRLLNQEIARSFFRRVVERAHGLMSDEHFTVDGTLIEAWASQKSFQRKDGGPTATAATSAGSSGRTTRTPRRPTRTARLYRKSNGAESRLAYLGHLLIENRHGLIADAMATVADGYGEREAATLMVCAQWERAPVAAARWAPTRRMTRRVREADARIEHDAARHAEPHAVGWQRDRRRTTRHEGYAKSQHARPRIEPAFGWLKTIAWMRKVKLRGLAKVDWLFVFASAAFNLIRLPKLLPRPA
jgi:transposase